MTDETHITRLIFESEGGPEAEANAKKISDANQRVTTSEEKKAAAVENAARRVSSARKGVEDSCSREVAAAARDADVVAKSEKIKVEAIGRTQSQINAIARRVDPIGAEYRRRADDVEKLNRTIESGVASGDSKKMALANQAAEVLPAAIKYRDRAQQAMNVAASAPDSKLTAEQERLNKAAEKYLDIIDATRPATREYNAEIAQLAELQAKGEMSALNAAIAEAKLTTEYDKKIHSLSGAAAAAKEQEILNASVRKYRDEMDPTLPVMRAYADELRKIEELKSTRTIETPEARDILVRVTTDYTKKIAEANGSAEADRNAAKAAAEYQKQIETLKETIDPLATAEKRRADAVSFANQALASGDLDDRQHALALKLAASNYDKAAEAIKKHGGATAESTKHSQQMQFALTNLSYQVNDVATSLASGISPARTFAQQAGQFVQVFQVNGGAKKVLSEAGAAIAGWITPTRVALAGFGALGVGALLLANRAATAQQSAKQFDVVLRGLGAGSLATGANLEETAKKLRSVGLSADDARKQILAVTRAGLNPAQAGRIVTTGQDIGTLLGGEGTQTLTDALSNGLDPTVKLGLQLRAFTSTEVATWREMARIGRESDAVVQAFAKIEAKVKGANDSALSPTARAMRELRVAWGEALDGFSKLAPISALTGALQDLATVLGKIVGYSTSEAIATISGALTGAAVGARVGGLYGAAVGGAVGAAGGAYYGARATEASKPVATAPIPPASSPPSASGSMTSGATRQSGDVAFSPIVPAATSPGAARLDTSRIGANTVALDELTKVLSEASKSLPPGYSVKATSGQRYGSGDSLHNEGKAIDVQIIGPDKVALPNKGPIGSDPGLYKDLAIAAYRANQAMFPGTNLTWGGRFETEPGSKQLDFMHFDRGVDRGRFGMPLAQLAGGSTAVAASDQTKIENEDLEKQKVAVNDVVKERQRETDVLEKIGASSEIVRAKQEAENRAVSEHLSPEQKNRLETELIANAYRRVAVEQNKVIDQTALETKGVGDVAKGYTASLEAGLKAESQAKAVNEAFQAYGEIESGAAKSLINRRTQQLLESEATTAIKTGREQVATEQPQLAREAQLLAATIRGTKAAKDQEIQNAAGARAQEALAKAKNAGLPGLAAEAKAVEDAALAQEKYKVAVEQGTQAAAAANDNRVTLRRTQVETNLVSTGLTQDQITRQLDYYDAATRAAKEFGNVDVDEKAKAARDAYIQTANAVADAKYQLTLAQREQEKWNNLVGDLANKIDSELTTSIENAFSEDKVESWGKRINKWLGSFSSTLSSSLFIKPALGTVAGALGFGTVSQSLGSFGSLGSLFGDSTSSASGGSSGGVSVEKSSDGTVTIKGLQETTAFTNSLLGTNSGGIFSNLSTDSNTVTSSNDNIYGTLSGAGSKSLFNNTDSFVGTLSGSSSTGTVGSSLSSTGSSLFSLDTLKGVGAGFGAGTVLNNLIGGNKTTGTIGSGVGSLAGSAIGSLVGFPILGGITGGLFGSLGGLFGQTNKRANATGVSIDLSTGKASGFTSSGSAENDKTLKEIRDDLTKFTTGLQSSTGGATSGYINPQATDQGIKLDYNIPGFGAGIYNTKDSQEAIDNAELAIVKGLTGVSDLTQMVIDKYSGNIDDLKTALDAAASYKDTKVTDTISTVIDKTTDPSKLADSLKFAETYDKINDAAKDAFSSIPADLKITGPFEKARDDIKTTFDDITDSAKEFGLSLEPVTAAFDEANKRLKEDFNRNINDLLEVATDPLQSLVDIEKRAGDARVKEAESVAGDIESVNKLNAKNLDKIWTDQTASIQDLRDEFKTGDLSGLTDYQRLPAARTKYVDTLKAVQGGDTSKWDTLITDAKNLFSLSKGAYGEGPKTAEWRTAITAVLDNVLAGRTFAVGAKATPPGTILVGEKGPELITQPGGLHVHTHNETERLLSSGAAAQAATVPDSKVAHLFGRPFPSGTTGASPEVIVVTNRRLAPISHERNSRLQSSRDTKRAISILSPVSGAVSIANSNSSVASNSSTSAVDGSSSISNQNIITAFTKTLPVQAITAGAADAINGVVLVGAHGSELTPPQDRAVVNFATAVPPETISRAGSLDVHSNRKAERIVSALAPSSVAPSSATSNLSVIYDPSTVASDNSSILSVQNITAALGRTAPSRAFAGGTEATPPGVIMIGEPIGMPHDHAFAAGTKSTPPGTVLVGEKGPELVSQPGGLHVYTHRETEKILSAMPQASGHGIATDDHRYKTPNVISLTVLKEGMVATSSLSAGVDSTPAGTILVGEKGPELITQPGALHVHSHVGANKILSSLSAGSNDNMPMPLGRSFAGGTAGQYNNIVHLPTSVGKPLADGMIGQHGNVSNLTMFSGGAFANGTIGQYANVVHQASPADRAFANGTTGQYANVVHLPIFPVMSFANGTTGQNNTIAYLPMSPVMSFAGGTDNQDDKLSYLPSPKISFSGASEVRRGPDNAEVAKLLRDVVTAVKVNNNITRVGHLETGDEIRKQTTVIQKTSPHTPTRRRA